MKSNIMVVNIVVCVALFLMSGAGELSAQTPVKAASRTAVVRLHQLTGYGPRALKYSDSAGNGSRGRNSVRAWAELGVQYDSEPDWIDELTFQYYALLRSRVTGEYSLLKGSVTYVDVARGRSHLGVAYIRPNALLRLGEIVGVAVEAQVKGEVVASLSEGRLGPSKPLPTEPGNEWWKKPELVPREGYIVEKSKTPFALINFDDYESVK
jgi:hypothetical protein